MIHSLANAAAWLCIGLALPAGMAWAAAKPVPKAQAKVQAKVAAPVALQPRQPSAQLGHEKGDTERCFECHGENGQGPAHHSEGIFAKLAGQPADYLLRQIEHFRSNKRDNASMALMARTVSTEDLQDIAAYFAALPPMRGSSGTGSRLNARAEQLLAQGDASKGIAACAACHGEQGRGIAGQAAPVLAGQDLNYLKRQLWTLRDGSRSEVAPAVMGPVARQLSDADIDALISHLSAL
ncbi:c-type cytochrome [Paucibacter sp. TC2R-5]|uniref:c-type cytochrome n=1 Tax=Paucibacter sp. TC2R-5 TaxID=2893555 RepID=UPI0021E488D0|nr:c-type cytochrome [Paucibacter sp. TC2R-5]MCV2361275.1 c-type cytochrome [Paucibacter sp. TC2R-5]